MKRIRLFIQLKWRKNGRDGGSCVGGGGGGGGDGGGGSGRGRVILRRTYIVLLLLTLNSLVSVEEVSKLPKVFLKGLNCVVVDPFILFYSFLFLAVSFHCRK